MTHTLADEVVTSELTGPLLFPCNLLTSFPGSAVDGFLSSDFYM